MKWSRNKSTKNEDEDSSKFPSTALVRQDPRTSVKTTSAQSETTNTTTQNSTIFNTNANRVTYQSTKQTVTSRQTARITEITTRRTPTPQELEEMMLLLHMNKKPETKTFTTTTTTSSGPQRRNRPSNLPALPPSSSRSSFNSISPKSTTKFKSTASPVSRLIFNYESPPTGSGSAGGRGGGGATGFKTPITPTLVKTQTTTVSEKNGRTITQRVEEHRIKLDPKTFKLSTPNSPLTRNYTGEDSYKFTASDARPIVPALALPPLSVKATTTAIFKPTTSTTYTSPYTQRVLNQNKTTSNVAFTSSTKPISSIAKSTAGLTTKSGSLFSSWPTTTTTTTTTLSKPIATTSFQTPTAKPIPAINKAAPKPREKPGYAYIINNVTFDNPANEERVGSAEDVKALVQTFEHFKMKVTVIENAKVDKIRKTVEKIQTKDFKDYACLVIVILSHGSRHEEIAAKDGHYSIDDHILFPILRNATLNDKPKLFFIQACKGSMESNGYYKDATPFLTPGSANEILKCYSTFEGFVSYRTDKGSIFIQALCQNLKLFGGTKNVKDIMEKVTQIVKQQSQNKQIPAYTSTLTKPFVFGDYVK